MAHDTHCPLEDKDKDKYKDKDKDRVLKRPSICYFFGKQGAQGYQILHSDQSTGQLFVGQPDQPRPDQTRPKKTKEDLNLADLMIELAFLLMLSSVKRYIVASCN